MQRWWTLHTVTGARIQKPTKAILAELGAELTEVRPSIRSPSSTKTWKNSPSLDGPFVCRVISTPQAHSGKHPSNSGIISWPQPPLPAGTIPASIEVQIRSHHLHNAISRPTRQVGSTWLRLILPWFLGGVFHFADYSSFPRAGIWSVGKCKHPNLGNKGQRYGRVCSECDGWWIYPIAIGRRGMGGELVCFRSQEFILLLTLIFESIFSILGLYILLPRLQLQPGQLRQWSLR